MGGPFEKVFFDCVIKVQNQGPLTGFPTLENVIFSIDFSSKLMAWVPISQEIDLTTSLSLDQRRLL